MYIHIYIKNICICIPRYIHICKLKTYIYIYIKTTRHSFKSLKFQLLQIFHENVSLFNTFWDI